MFEVEVELFEDEFALIRDYVYEKTGMYFKENKKYLIKSRLAHRLKELKITSYKDYYYRVKFDMKEQAEMINSLTTNETSFFRNPHHMKEIETRIIPDLLQRQKMIKIWSAGSSSGEEAYSIAMIIAEMRRKGLKFESEIVGTDIDENILRMAREGVYTQNSFRSVEPHYVKTYFTPHANTFVLNADIKSMVKFSKLNLVDFPKMAAMKNYDIILCRNVLIYFSHESRKKVIEHFFLSLNRNGYFILGHSETLHGIFDGFKIIHVPGAVLYKKE